MTGDGTFGLWSVWRARPRWHSRALWALLIVLDLLPWPWGEDLLSALFAGITLLRGDRRRHAFAWASHHPGRGGWRRALGSSAFLGRWVARSSLLGVRNPAQLRDRIVLRGEQHLIAAGKETTGTILLGFHLGPPNVDVALRSMGYRLAWLGNRRASRAWSRPEWRPLLDPAENLCPPPGRPAFWPGCLYRARRILLDGGTIFMMADALTGRAVFHIPLPGQPAVVRPGWLGLWRQTRARVLLVLTHLDGRDQIITVHPPLPMTEPDDGATSAEWKQVLSVEVTDHVRRFPDQCPVLVFALGPESP